MFVCRGGYRISVDGGVRVTGITTKMCCIRAHVRNDFSPFFVKFGGTPPPPLEGEGQALFEEPDESRT